METWQVHDPLAIASFLSGLLLGAFLVWLWGRFQLQKATEGLKLEIATLEARCESAERSCREIDHAHSRIASENGHLKILVAELKKEAEVNQDKLQWVEKAQEKMREAFDALAGQALNASTTHFLKHAREQVENLIAMQRPCRIGFRSLGRKNTGSNSRGHLILL